MKEFDAPTSRDALSLLCGVAVAVPAGREELENKIAVLLGGCAAEGVIFGHLATGASDDLAPATGIARSMATRYGMNEELGFVSYEEAKRDFLGRQGGSDAEVGYSETTAELIDAAVRETIPPATSGWNSPPARLLSPLARRRVGASWSMSANGL